MGQANDNRVDVQGTGAGGRGGRRSPGVEVEVVLSE